MKKISGKHILLGIFGGVLIFLLTTPVGREKAKRIFLQISGQFVLKVKEAIDQSSARLMKAIKEGIEEAKRKEEELQEKMMLKTED